MSTVNISLPEELKAFVDTQVDNGSYESANDYLEALVREAQIRHARRALEAELVEGLRSEASDMTRQDWEDIRRDGEQRLAARKAR